MMIMMMMKFHPLLFDLVEVTFSEMQLKWKIPHGAFRYTRTNGLCGLCRSPGAPNVTLLLACLESDLWLHDGCWWERMDRKGDPGESCVTFSDRL